MSGNKKQSKTIRKKYGTKSDPKKHWRTIGRKGAASGGGRPFRDTPGLASKAAKARWDKLRAEKKRTENDTT